MSSLISGATSSTSSAATGTQNGRYWGLASGLDVDSIVTALVSKNQTQIDKANQSKQSVVWQQSAYQSITGSLNTFMSTYLDLSSSSSMLLSNTFSTYAANSTNSAVTAKALAGAAQGQHTIDITQSAVAGSVTGKKLVSTISGTNTSATLDSLNGTSFNITVDGVTKSVSLSSTDTYKDSNNVTQNDLAGVLQNKIDTAFGISKVKVDSKGGSISFRASDAYSSAVISVATTGNSITGTTSFSSILTDDKLTLTDKAAAFKAKFSGTNFDISINGQPASTISFSDSDFDASFTDITSLFQSKVDAAVGSGKVKVSFNSSGDISFQSNGPAAPVISLTNTSGSTSNTLDALGIKSGTKIADSLTGLGITSGGSNLYSSGQTLSSIFGTSITASGGNFSVNIDGKGIALSTNDSLDTTLSKINAANAGVIASYSSTTGKVSIVSNTTGADTTVQLTDSGNSGFFTAVLGSSSDRTTVTGKDAVFTLDNTLYTRNTNNFTIDHINYNINTTIDGSTTNPEQKATINMAGDVSTAVKSITDFVNAYNTLVKSIYSQVTTKPDSNYPPLTDTQKSSMKDTDVTAWNQKAQAGVLFGDDTLNSILTSMTNTVNQSVTTTGGKTVSLYDIGISVSPDYLDGNVLQIDTDKLTKALQNDPDSVQQLFTKSSSVMYDIGGGSSQTTRQQQEGFGFRLQDVINNATKTGVYPYCGSLIRIAGTASDNSTNYELNAKLKDINANITKYTADMKTKKDQLYTKFSRLESLMEQMNSQSSMISSFASSGS